MDNQTEESLVSPTDIQREENTVEETPALEPVHLQHHNKLVVVIFIILFIVAVITLFIIGGQKPPTTQTSEQSSNQSDETLADKTFASIVANTSSMTWSSPVTGTETYKSNGVFGTYIQATLSDITNDPLLSLLSDEQSILKMLGWEKNKEMSIDGNVTYFESKTDGSTHVLIIRKNGTAYNVFVVM